MLYFPKSGQYKNYGYGIKLIFHTGFSSSVKPIHTFIIVIIRYILNDRDIKNDYSDGYKFLFQM